MMVITSVVKHKNNPDMLRLYINGEYAFSIPEEEYFRLSLYERKELEQSEIDAIREEAAIKMAKNNAIRLLSAKDRSEQEVRERLILRGYDADIATEAVLQLKAMGYINDSLFAHKYVSDRLKLKPMSKKALAAELKKKGIKRDIIDEVLGECELDELSVAYRLAKKKFGKYNAAEPAVQRKIYSFLAYRGYSSDMIQDVLQKMQE